MHPDTNVHSHDDLTPGDAEHGDELAERFAAAQLRRGRLGRGGQGGDTVGLYRWAPPDVQVGILVVFNNDILRNWDLIFKQY